MILEDMLPVNVHKSKKIKMKYCSIMVSKPETKEYKFIFKKCRLMDNFDSLPYKY